MVLSNIPGEKAAAVRKALEPDNVDFPEGLSLYVEDTDNKLVFDFESKNGMRQLIGTVDEVLEHVQVALGVME